eukprot:g16365.t1
MKKQHYVIIGGAAPAAATGGKAGGNSGSNPGSNAASDHSAGGGGGTHGQQHGGWTTNSGTGYPGQANTSGTNGSQSNSWGYNQQYPGNHPCYGEWEQWGGQQHNLNQQTAHHGQQGKGAGKGKQGKGAKQVVEVTGWRMDSNQLELEHYAMNKQQKRRNKHTRPGKGGEPGGVVGAAAGGTNVGGKGSVTNKTAPVRTASSQTAPKAGVSTGSSARPSKQSSQSEVPPCSSSSSADEENTKENDGDELQNAINSELSKNSSTSSSQNASKNASKNIKEPNNNPLKEASTTKNSASTADLKGTATTTAEEDEEATPVLSPKSRRAKRLASYVRKPLKDSNLYKKFAVVKEEAEQEVVVEQEAAPGDESGIEGTIITSGVESGIDNISSGEEEKGTDHVAVDVRGGAEDVIEQMKEEVLLLPQEVVQEVVADAAAPKVPAAQCQ